MESLHKITKLASLMIVKIYGHRWVKLKKITCLTAVKKGKVYNHFLRKKKKNLNSSQDMGIITTVFLTNRYP